MAFAHSGIWLSADEVDGEALVSFNKTVGLAMFVMLSLAIIDRKHIGRVALSRQAAICAGILGTLGTITIILTGPYYQEYLLAAIGNPSWIFAVAACICGIAMAILYLQFAMRYCILPFRYAVLYLCYAYLIAVFVYMATVISPDWAITPGAPTNATVIVFSLMPLTAIPFLTVRTDPSRWLKPGDPLPKVGFTPISHMGAAPGLEAPEPDFSHAYGRFVIVFLLFSIVCSGISTDAVIAASPELMLSQYNSVTLLHVPIIAAMVIVIIIVDAEHINFSKLCIAAIAILEACAIAGLVIPSSNATWFITVSTVSFVFELFVWLLIFAVGGCHRQNAVFVVGLGLSLYMLGQGIGPLLSQVLGTSSANIPGDLVFAVLLLPAFIFIGEKDINKIISLGADQNAPKSMSEVLSEKIETTGKVKGPFRVKLEAYAKEHGLTARETEALRYLAAGRGDNQIAQAMGVSYNTARTHVRNVYSKCGVHSRQELIDYIDANLR
jgi:DNA-binding CsgD family transcriptional regulator